MRRLDEHIHFVETFASDVSHEFKNPLASIRTATEMLAEVDDPTERKRFLLVVQHEVARMEHLLSGVREITRLDAGAGLEEREPVELGGLLRGLVESYRLRGVDRFALELAEKPLPVQGWPERLAQVFENVIDNALGFGPPDRPIEIRLEREDDEAVVRVADRGPGIPDAHLERIFDRFFSYRPDPRDDAGQHTGLGLAIARATVESAGGSMSAGNRPDGGAVFEIRLPLREDAS